MIEEDDPAHIDVWTMVVLDHNPLQSRTNLRAPILVSRRIRKAVQVILAMSVSRCSATWPSGSPKKPSPPADLQSARASAALWSSRTIVGLRCYLFPAEEGDHAMLVLARKCDEAVVIDGTITVRGSALMADTYALV